MMHPQTNVITIGVSDIQRAKDLYSEGLGLPLQKDAGEFVSLGLGDGSPSLALYRREALAADAGVDADTTGFRAVTLSYIVATAEQVDAVLAAAARAGGEIVKPAKRALWGGYSGHFADPDGHLWKVASNKGPSRLRRRSGEAIEPSLPQESAVTLGVGDMARSKRFYADGLGCPVDKSYAKFVSFALGEGSWDLSLYGRQALADDAGLPVEGSGFRGVTLSAIVDSAEQVDAVLAAADAAGGTIVKPAEGAAWGGYSGHFADPDGHLWKVASAS
jgi:catechol 2,3-dioxygenase-like lactoylglutathione lyase family enzyme